MTRSWRWQYLLAAAGIAGIICLIALRGNSEHMSSLRTAVYSADKSNGDVQGALQDLQKYVTAHMNTDLTAGSNVYPPIQLQYTYQRLIEQQSGIKAQNSDLYTQAQAYCQSINSTDYSGRNRVPCISQYVQDHGSATTFGKPVSPSLYQFNFASPKWSPDIAGWSLALSIVLAGLASIKLTASIIFKKHK